MSGEKNSIVLLSSGLDSSVALALAKAQGYSIRLCLTFDYGQRARHQEIAQAQKIAHFFEIPHRTVTLPFFLEGSESRLLHNAHLKVLPQLSLADLDNEKASQESAKAVWVPNRNGVFLEIAACFAEQMNAPFVIVGFNREEAITFPDNSKAYREAITRALSFSTANQVHVISPTEDLNKIEIVKKALELNLPLEFLWSCYQEGNQMCGTCESCMRLKRALKHNEVRFCDFFANSAL